MMSMKSCATYLTPKKGEKNMGAVYAFRPATKQETKYAYSCEDGDKICKCIGHLRADFGSSGKGFWSSWFDHNAELKTDKFRDALDAVINRMRSETHELSPLKNRVAMSKVCHDYSEAKENDSWLENYIFRVDVLADGSHSFIMRMNPTPGVYNLYCYCYETKNLEGGLV